MTSIKFVNTQALRGSPPTQYTKSNTSPVAPVSSSLPSANASSANPQSFDFERQMRIFLVEKRGHGSQQQHSTALALTAPFAAPPPRGYVRSSRSKPWFIAPPPGGRGLVPAIATSATYYASPGKVVTRTEVRPVHRGSPTLSHKSSSSASSSPVEAPSAHNRSRPKANPPDNNWGARPTPSAAPPTVPQGPNDIPWAAPSPTNSPQPSPSPRPLTHIESPLLPPLPSTTLPGRSGSLTRRNNSDLKIVPPPLTPTGVAGKTGLPPPPVSPPMPKPRSSPARVRKTSDVLDTVYSIYNKLPTSRDRRNSDSGDRDFVSRLATRIVPRRNTPSPSPPPTSSPHPTPQPQNDELPPTPPPKPRPGDVSPPVIPLIELPGTTPSTPPQSRSPARSRSPRLRSPRGSRSPRSPPPSRESQEVYSKLPLPAVPAPTPTKPLFSSGPSALPKLSPLSNPPTGPAPGSISVKANFDVDLGYADELVEWFENFCYPCESASTVTTPSPRTPRTPNTSTTFPSSPPSPKKDSTTKTPSTDPTVVILSDGESPITGRQHFAVPQPSLEVEHNPSPDFLSPFKVHNSGVCPPKRKPVPVSMYSTASSVGDAFRFDCDDLHPISDGGSTASGEDDEDAILAGREVEKLQGQIEDILNNAIYLRDVGEVEGEGEVEREGEWRKTMYIAGRNSALEGDVIFCLKACEL